MDSLTLKHYRINLKEYKDIKTLLGYNPSQIELVLFSALWSEHCSYKSSIVHLKKLHLILHLLSKVLEKMRGLWIWEKGKSSLLKWKVIIIRL